MIVDELSASLSGLLACTERAEWRGNLELVVFVFCLGNDSVFDFL